MTDQGHEGACVGHGWTGEAMASPERVKIGVTRNAAYQQDPSLWATMLYREAQALDEWPGHEYEGTSVLGGAKAMQRRGLIGEYRWASSIEDVRDSIIALGPVIIGVDWYESMYETDPLGKVVITGHRVGGHCLLLYGYNPRLRLGGTTLEAFRWRNSWGTGYGNKGNAIIAAADLERLLSVDGAEACIPLQRFPKPAS